jgi:hypothetical protein
VVVAQPAQRVEEQVEQPLRRSARIAVRATTSRAPIGSTMSNRNAVASRERYVAGVKRGRLTRPVGFLEEVLGALYMENEDEMNGTLGEVEEILSMFYEGREG